MEKVVNAESIKDYRPLAKKIGAYFILGILTIAAILSFPIIIVGYIAYRLLDKYNII